MNRKELMTKLEEERINPRYYSIFGFTEPPIEEQCVLQKEGDKWVVYYLERGQKMDLKAFKTEDEACRHFFDDVLSYPDLRM